MIAPSIDTRLLKKIIIDVAKKELMPRFANVTHTAKADKSIVTEADIATQKSIIEQLQQHWPEIQLLGEEMSTEEQVQIFNNNQAMWCLDPLDGTSNFAAGIPYFAISLALLFEAKVILAVVYDPTRDELFFAEDNNGKITVSLNDKALSLAKSQRNLETAVALVDLKRLSKDMASRIATEQPFASQRNFGASALDWCWLATSRSHIYLHGNQNIWDYAAGELILRGAGGLSQTLNGEPVFKAELEKRSVVAAVDKELFNEWTTWLNN